jgi:hypothetical protein
VGALCTSVGLQILLSPRLARPWPRLWPDPPLRLATEAALRRRRLDSYRLVRTTSSIRNRYLCKVTGCTVTELTAGPQIGAGLPSHLGHGALPVPRPSLGQR